MKASEFGGYIRNLRESANITRAEVCDELSITRAYYSRIELHNEVPSATLLIKMAAILKTPLNTLFQNAIDAKCDTYQQRQKEIYTYH